MNNSKDIEALEGFLLNNPELDKLEGLLSQFNIFETLNMVISEVRHSNVLAWLLNPASNHGLGDFFLKQFLKYFISENKSTISSDISFFVFEILNYSNTEIRREWNNIDILIVINEENYKIVFAIENKVKSSEHSNQLQRYREIVEKEFHDYHKFFVYLTPENLMPSDENWSCFGYATIAKLMDDLLEYKRDSINDNIYEFISQYNTILRRYIVGNSEVEQICKQIYKKHSTALDLIFQYKPDIQLDISEYLQEKIKTAPDIVLDSAGKTLIRFTTPTIDENTEKISEGWVKSKRIFLFEFYNYENQLKLHLYIGPGSQDYREKLFRICNKSPQLFKLTQRKFGSKYHAVYQKVFLTKKDIENLLFEELKMKIDTKWDDFISGDLIKIHDHLKKELSIA